MSIASKVGSVSETKFKEPSSWLSRLSRVTTSGRFIPEIDGFRFIAILGVFLLHDLGQVMAKNGVGVDAQRHVQFDLLHGLDRLLAPIILTCGGFGVSLFFVISGFVLALPFADHHLMGKTKPALSAYLLRRVTRLEPPFLVNLVVQTLVLSAYYRWHLGDTVRHWIATALYMHTQVYQEASPINGATWSLEVEVQFYLLAPLLGWLFAVNGTAVRRAVLAALILGIGILNSTVAPRDFRYQNSLAFFIPFFLAGFLLADVYLRNPSFLLQKKHIAWDWAAVLSTVVMIVTLVEGGGDRGPMIFFLPVCILTFYVACFKSVFINRILTSPPIYLIGGMCYTIYLYHGLMVAIVAQLTRKLYFHSLPLWMNYPIQFALHAALVLLACIVLFRLIERPCMKRDWPQRLWRWMVRRTGRKNANSA